jgi:ubiquinone/menaquinone biosynthesis C-methylase UbiE
MSNSDYFRARLPLDERRETLWRALVKFYFSKLITSQDTVLELGAGYGHFINNVSAARRLAVDIWDDFRHYLNPDVEAHVGSVQNLDWITDQSLDFVFASNLFEHVSQPVFTEVLNQLRRKLSERGTITILQPNYRFAYREYFDDYTHITVYSDISICEFLVANGYEIIECRPRFLPLTIKSRLKVSPLLIRAYLLSPFKPLGKQMLIRARPARC